MILNSYAVLDGFVSLLRLVLGLFVLWLGLSTWRTWRRRVQAVEDRKILEDRGYLLLLLAWLLLVLNVAAWPIFYLLLQSYVPEWPGVMCIYGVTRIGTGSLGISRFLPTLVKALELLKPGLVFLSGAWFVLYLVNRRTHTAPLTGRVLALLVVVGFLAVADAAAEVTYLGIPKREVFLSAGCCTGALGSQEDASRFLPRGLVGEGAEPWLCWAFYAVNLGMVLVLWACKRVCRRHLPVKWLLSLLGGSGLSVVVSTVFLVDVAAPRLLANFLPHHHCPYDLVPQAPVSVAAMAIFLGGCFCVGWACVAGWLGRDAESRPFLAEVVGRLLHLAYLGYLGSVMMMSVELVLA
jgi:hypothetical protein